jgi:hypothetical protein
MVYIKDNKKYYTLKESSDILDQNIKKRAKKFSKEVVSRVNNKKKEIYV